jgi:hypothetical protein
MLPVRGISVIIERSEEYLVASIFILARRLKSLVAEDLGA